MTPISFNTTENKAACLCTSTRPINRVHLQENKDGHVFVPLCAKPSFLALLDQHPHLLEKTINHCLATTTEEQDIIIFIADGAVMEEAFMAMDRPARAQRITSAVASQIKIKVVDALANINNPRIKGVVHWEDVASSTQFQEALTSMEHIMNAKFDTTEEEEEEGLMVTRVQCHIKTLVKNLFTQRVEKAHKAGTNITNVFTGKGLEIRTGGRYAKRYRHLETCMHIGAMYHSCWFGVWRPGVYRNVILDQ